MNLGEKQSVDSHRASPPGCPGPVDKIRLHAVCFGSSGQRNLYPSAFYWLRSGQWKMARSSELVRAAHGVGSSFLRIGSRWVAVSSPWTLLMKMRIGFMTALYQPGAAGEEVLHHGLFEGAGFLPPLLQRRQLRVHLRQHLGDGGLFGK
jgi:hypothetical protein